MKTSREVAYSYLNNDAVPSSRIATVPFEGGKPTKQLDSFRFRVPWTTDGRSLLYLKDDAGVSNVWSQRVGSGVSKQITHFQSDIIFDFAVSPDGKWIAFTRGTSNRDVVLVGDAK